MIIYCKRFQLEFGLTKFKPFWYWKDLRSFILVKFKPHDLLHFSSDPIGWWCLVQIELNTASFCQYFDSCKRNELEEFMMGMTNIELIEWSIMDFYDFCALQHSEFRCNLHLDSHEVFSFRKFLLKVLVSLYPF